MEAGSDGDGISLFTAPSIRRAMTGGECTGSVTKALLPPSTHLTDGCWRDFNRYVKSFAGWKAKRRAATLTEVIEHSIYRKAKAYWTDVTYTACSQVYNAKCKCTLHDDDDKPDSDSEEQTPEELAAFKAKKTIWFREYMGKRGCRTMYDVEDQYAALYKWYPDILDSQGDSQ
jgi:hypothetical protein